jgi:hypothetical protein
MLYLAVAHQVVQVADANLTDWLTAGGGLGAFIATGILAGVAVRQIGLAREQMGKLDDQVKAAQDQVDAMKQTSAAELSAVRDQIAASVEQNRAVREAARAQLQPVVLAHATQIIEGPNDEYSIREDQVAIAYFVANEGSGIALNIRHGVKIDGERHEYGDGLQIRVLGPGESQPIRDPAGDLIWRVPMFVVRPREELPIFGSRSYWASFQNVFGERFETVNPIRPDVPFLFRRVDGAAS